jgi:hypothetical protein
MMVVGLIQEVERQEAIACRGSRDIQVDKPVKLGGIGEIAPAINWVKSNSAKSPCGSIRVTGMPASKSARNSPARK